jgi:hypothetical protein
MRHFVGEDRQTGFEFQYSDNNFRDSMLRSYLV